MLRFANILATELGKQLPVEVIRPPALFGHFFSAKSFVGKWVAYIDKYVVFPFLLVLHRLNAARKKEPCVYHICDHSNAVYAIWLKGLPTVVTCHDLLAVRGAIGDRDAWCSATRTGRLLQKWIFKSLRSVPFVACVSNATRGDLTRLANESDPEKYPVISLAAESTFGSPTVDPFNPQISLFPKLENREYLLTVGASHPRKNRKAMFSILARARQSDPDLTLVIAGLPITPEERAAAEEANVELYTMNPVGLEDSQINALYRGARALVIPSWSEGFGWPVIEAQQAGCPVIASNRTSLPEVAGEGALIFDPNDHAGMANAAVQLANPVIREAEIQRGFQNLQRFSMERMIDSYLKFYQKAYETSG